PARGSPVRRGHLVPRGFNDDGFDGEVGVEGLKAGFNQAGLGQGQGASPGAQAEPGAHFRSRAGSAILARGTPCFKEAFSPRVQAQYQGANSTVSLATQAPAFSISPFLRWRLSATRDSKSSML